MEYQQDTTFPFDVYIINLDRKPERFDYVSKQLDAMKITNYQRWIATDGFNADPGEMINIGVTPKLTERGGLAGCASSHIRMWKHIADNKLGWTLILEDDAHFHPNFIELFKEYWKNVPTDAKIVFPGFCGDETRISKHGPVSDEAVMCLHAYMLSHDGAQYLLDNLLPMTEPVDIELKDHFAKLHHKGSYIFNGSVLINGVVPNDYKNKNGKRCMFNGIVYQNQGEQGSTIHKQETVYE